LVLNTFLIKTGPVNLLEGESFMDVICEMMKLKPENVKDYIEMHNNTWPELIKAIKDSGFVEEYIYILDNLVIVIMKCEDFKKSCKILLDKEIFQKWTTKVRSMLMEDEPFFKTKDKIIDLEPVWNLADF
jgi:L-rhamnose mutarotase